LCRGCEFPGITAAAADTGDPSLWAVGILGLFVGHGLQEGRKVALQAQGNQTFRQWEPWGLLNSASFQDPQELLQSWENKACGQQEPWGLFAGEDYQKHSIAAAASTVESTLLAYTFCYLWSSKSPGFSWHFRVKGSWSCSRREHGAPSSCMSQEAGLTTKCQVMKPGAPRRLQGQVIGSAKL
jgi:hypothetical protein